MLTAIFMTYTRDDILGDHNFLFDINEVKYRALQLLSFI